MEHSEERLHAFIGSHISYEVRNLRQQFVIFMTMVETGRRELVDPVHIALFNSILMFLRSLDSFVLSRPQKDDVCASDYIVGWECPGILTEDERSDINGHLAHLAARRLDQEALWDLRSMCEKAGEIMSDFGFRAAREPNLEEHRGYFAFEVVIEADRLKSAAYEARRFTQS